MARVRDLKEMQEICDKATPDPWEYDSDGDNVIIKMADALGDETLEGYESQHKIMIDIFAATDEQMIEAENNAEFIAESREGWPEAINRAMDAEDKNKELINLHEKLINKILDAENLITEMKDALENLGRGGTDGAWQEWFDKAKQFLAE